MINCCAKFVGVLVAGDEGSAKVQSLFVNARCLIISVLGLHNCISASEQCVHSRFKHAHVLTLN